MTACLYKKSNTQIKYLTLEILSFDKIGNT